MTSQSGQGSAQFGSSARRGIFACLITLAAAMMALPLGASGQIVTIRVATASNFANTARSLSAIFQESRDVRVVIVAGSTGKHYAQIRNGAPFDVAPYVSRGIARFTLGG